MKLACIVLIAFSSCQLNHSDKQALKIALTQKTIKPPELSYDELKKNIAEKRKTYHKTELNDSLNKIITALWVRTVGNDLFEKWKDTPWDFNGTTTTPQKGNIACGFFVTTLLHDMDLKINRVKLAVCASSLMMRSLVPGQKLQNLSFISYKSFNDSISGLGKGVYVIGLDFHTGFIVNDGEENWFIHSNYINRKGVTKEKISESKALAASKTRWLVTLTGDQGFLKRWISAQ